MRLISALALFGLLLVSSCAHKFPQQANWPKEIPPIDFFVAHFDTDLENKKGQPVEEYLMWVERFYSGWELYRNGWIKVTAASLHNVKDPLLAEEIHTKMNLIGQAIACEWAKNKKDRRIHTRHIVVWGNALIESIKRDQELALINRVLADVNALLANQVAIEEIKPVRYFSEDGDDTFM